MNLKKEIYNEKNRPTRSKKNGFWLVSGGYLAKPNDVIVDNATKPTVVLGEVDKNGEFQRKIELWSDWLEKN